MTARKISSDSGLPDDISRHLLRPHRLVSELRAAAREADEDKGVLRLNFEKVLRVRTSKQQLRRALLLMDALIKLFEKNGCVVRIGTKYTETELVLTEGVISFRLDERTTRVVPPESVPNSGRRGNRQLEYEGWHPRVMRGTGEFSLEFGKYVLKGSQHVWRDSDANPLERQLPQIIEAIPAWEAILKSKRLEREAEESRRQEGEARRLLEARAREVLKRQRARLVSNVEAWERAERIRSLILAVKATGHIPGADSWIEWANAQVRALDPLHSNEALSLDVQLEPHFTAPNPWEKQAPADWWKT